MPIHALKQSRLQIAKGGFVIRDLPFRETPSADRPGVSGRQQRKGRQSVLPARAARLARRGVVHVGKSLELTSLSG